MATAPHQNREDASDAKAAPASAVSSAVSPSSGSIAGRLRGGPFRLADLLAQTPAWLTSMLVHMVALVVMALWTQKIERPQMPRELVVTDAAESDQLDEAFDDPLSSPNIDLASTDTAMVADVTTLVADPVDTSFMEDAGQLAVEPLDFASEIVPSSNLLASVNDGILGGMKGIEGRGTASRGLLVAKRGGTAASEAAVSSGLKWLASVQLPDGSWTFDHVRIPSRKGRGSNPGEFAGARNAATAIALLPFLGAGQTHVDGQYKKTVAAGLGYLSRSMNAFQGVAGSYYEADGRMYSHGLCAIVMNEAYAMTQDKQLHVPAQLSLNFIAAAQDMSTGGWDYTPGQSLGGDTSIFGWQLMALKSGSLGNLEVSPRTIGRASNFLNLVQMEKGAYYGYRAPEKRAGTTAVGLLCRMYMGWRKENPALIQGVKLLSEVGPTNDIYYNYYATQVMHHYGGEEWEKWNNKMRETLIKQQVKEGIEQGSWYEGLDGGHGGEQGGRLYVTAMSTMILEVYYRHLPIYGVSSVEEDFPD